MLRALSTLALALVLPVPAAAQGGPPPPPVQLGPLGGAALSVVVDPNDDANLLVADFEGVRRSSDGGATFTDASAGLPLGVVSQLELDPAGGASVYAVAGSRVYEATSFGGAWNPLTLDDAGLRQIAVAPGASLLLAAAGTDLYRSTDQGNTWASVATGTLINTVTIAPSNPSVAYYGSIQGVFRSFDGGATFSATPMTSWAQTVLADPGNASTLFVGTNSGLLRSMDGATSFAPIDNGLPANANAELFGIASPGSRLWVGLLDGMWYSDDAGSTWNDGNAGFPAQPPIPTDLAFLSNGDALLSAEASFGGLWRANGSSPPWTHLAFAELLIFDVAVAGPGGQRIATAANGVYAAPQGQPLGGTAHQFDFGADTRVVKVHPTNPDRWVTGGVGAFIDNAQIVVLTNGGQTATKTFELFGGGFVTDLAFDPRNASRVLAGASNPFAVGSLLRSTNGGNTWSIVPGSESRSTTAIAWDPFSPGRAIQLTPSNQWSQSLDGGATFGPLQPAWPGGGPSSLLAFDPFVPGRMYRADEGAGLMRSTDGGVTWTSLGQSAYAASDLELHPDVPGFFWYSDASGLVLVSADGGDTFDTLFVVPSGQASGLAYDRGTGALVVGTTELSTYEVPFASPYLVLGGGSPGTGGAVPRAWATGGMPEIGNAAWTLGGDRIVGGGIAFLFLGTNEIFVPLFGGTVFSGPLWALEGVPLLASGTPGAAAAGSFTLNVPLPNNPILIGFDAISQYLAVDPGAADPSDVVVSDALRITFLP